MSTSSIRFFFPIAFFLLFGAFSTLRADIEMVVGITQTTLYEGESIGYQIALSDSKPLDDSIIPDISAFEKDFYVKTFPKQANSSSSFSLVINGRQVRQETASSVLFTYQLTPKKSGELTIPPPIVQANGKKLVPKTVKVGRETLRAVGDGSIPIRVLAPDSQDIVFAWIQVDRDRLYPFQPLTVGLVVQVKALPEELTENDPLSVLRDPPRLSIPWVDDRSLSKGLVPAQRESDWLTALSAGRGRRGFAINDYASRGLGFDDDFFANPFSARSGLLESKLLQFLPVPKKIKRPDADGNEEDYWEYRFDRTFVPEEFGALSFGPVTIKGAFAVADPSNRQGAAAKPVYAVAPSVSVHVADVPQTGRPDNYIGAFGLFDWSADIRPRKARVGEPLTLTFRLEGRGSTLGVKPLDLSAFPDVETHFKTHSPTEEADSNSCTFTYTIRPKNAGTIIFPPIPVSFFDVEKERFVTTQSEPIELNVDEASTLTDVVASTGMPKAFSGRLQRSEKGLFANRSDPSGAVDQSVDYVRWLQIVCALALVYIGTAGGVFIFRRRNIDPRRRRRAAALFRAKGRLSELRKELDGTNMTNLAEPCGLLRGILCGYIADRTDGVEQGMTTKDACRQLRELGVPETTIDEARSILETIDGARYGGFDLRSWDEMIDTADRLVRRLPGEERK